MSAKPSERIRAANRPRRKGLWRDLFADPVRKLIALALATLLWLFLDSQITDRAELSFKLIGERQAKEAAEPDLQNSYVVVLAPPGYRVTGFRNHMTNAETTFVEVMFEAPQHVLRNALTAPGLFVQPGPSDINQQTNMIVFDKDDLRSTDAVVLKALREMKPRRVDVLFERIEEKPLVLDKGVLRVTYPDAKVFPDFVERLRLDAAVFAPQQVTLRGPRSVINEVTRGQPLFTLDLTQAGGSTEPKLSAVLTPANIDRLSIEGGPVTITVPLDPQFESCELTVPVLVDSIGRGAPRSDDIEYDPTLTVRVRVSGELAGVLSRMSAAERDAWAKANARVDVRLDDEWHQQTLVLLGNLRLTDPHYERGRHYQTDSGLSVQIRPKAKRE